MAQPIHKPGWEKEKEDVDRQRALEILCLSMECRLLQRYHEIERRVFSRDRGISEERSASPVLTYGRRT
jgi:hypothetical protein